MQQIDFVDRLRRGVLPVSKRSQELTRDILPVTKVGDATIRAKSGLLGAEQGKPSLGWMVGWVEKGSQQTVFAMNMDCKEPSHIAARMTVTQQCLADIVAIDRLAHAGFTGTQPDAELALPAMGLRMLSRRSVVLGGLALSLGPARAWAQVPAEESVSAILRERVDVGRESLGLVAGVLDGDRRSVFAHGQSGSENNRPLDADTVFEIGSITKVFTALLFADMVVRGEVSPGDPVSKFLPREAQVPEFDGNPIKLLDLATYTSGLPRMPSNFKPADKSNPVCRLHGRAALRFSVRLQIVASRPGRITNTPISASACSAMRWPCAPA